MKYYPHGSVLFATLCVEEGLLLLANPLLQNMLKSCFARAQHLYPVKICHFVVEATHIHMILVVDNPSDVMDFMRHVKTDSAHMINGLLGRAKRTVWCEGYDSPVILTLPRALAAIAYLYANPAKDNLVESIDDFPGFTSWGMFQRGDLKKKWRYLQRPMFHTISRENKNPGGYRRLAQNMQAMTKTAHEFTLEPDAWLLAFNITDKTQQLTYNKKLVDRVRVLEKRAAKKRHEHTRRVMGQERLLNQVLDLSYRPERTGRRSWCIADRRAVRIPFIKFLKKLFALARDIRQRWFTGDYSQRYPLGLFPPSMPKLAEPLGHCPA